MLIAVCLVCLLAVGCNNFWANYYSIQPGTTDKSTVKQLLGNKPFGDAPNRLIYWAPQPDKSQLRQECIIYFNDAGIVVAKKRKNEMLQGPVNPMTGEIIREEIEGTVPDIKNQSTTSVRAK